jgi:hypothetical protein
LRVVRVIDAQMPVGAANPFVFQVPTSGNLFAIGYHSGGNTVSSISDGTNTWTCTGASINGNNAGQVCYAQNATPSNTLTLSVTRNATTTDATYMFYDITGAAASAFDVESGSLTGVQGSIVTSLTTCSSCLTPTNSNGIVIGESGWDDCTATAVTAPSGAKFDPATYTGNSFDGPQTVDQNNGWMHFYNSNTNAISMTWTMACGGNAENNWSGRVAAFKAPAGAPQQPAINKRSKLEKIDN